MTSRLAYQRDVRFMEIVLLIQTIQNAAARLAGQDPGQGLGDTLRDYRHLLYPERAEDLEVTGKRTEEILKREYEGGPMRVQAQDYDRKRPKKPR